MADLDVAGGPKAGDLWSAGNPIVVAHRGASGRAPENTEDAFRLAALLGADAVETDVRRTRDGALVLIHDETVDRTTDGMGRVRDLDLPQIRRLDAGRRRGEDFAGERILTLDEGLKLFGALGVGAVLEIKEPDTCAGIARSIRDRGFSRKCHMVSFFPGALRAVAEFDPELTGTLIFDPRGEIFRREDPAAGIIGVARECGAAGVGIFDAVAAPETIGRIKEAGIRFSVLLPNREDSIRRALQLEPDAILSNFPDRVRRVLREG